MQPQPDVLRPWYNPPQSHSRFRAQPLPSNPRMGLTAFCCATRGPERPGDSKPEQRAAGREAAWRSLGPEQADR